MKLTNKIFESKFYINFNSVCSKFSGLKNQFDEQVYEIVARQR